MSFSNWEKQNKKAARPGRAHSRATAKSTAGFTLLYAVLIASITLSIGIAIFNLTIKEVELSSIGRESLFAVYAADTAAECALFWDFTQDPSAFATSSPAGTVNCNGVERTVAASETSDGSGNTQYVREFTVSYADARCAQVTVVKQEEPVRSTTITARGYNTGYDSDADNCSAPSSRKVERGIRIRF